VVLPLRPFDLEELLDPAAAASGGSAEGEEGDGEDVACEAGPCASLSVCQAINCNADLPGLESLKRIGNENFCKFQARIPPSLRGAIVNPTCR
jgi:hypothetical protein